MLQIHHRHKRWQSTQHQQHPRSKGEYSVPQFSKQHHRHTSLCRHWWAEVPKLQLVKVVILITLCSSLVPGGVTRRARRHHGKHLVIHVPMKIRSHHHTHTVFTQLKGVGKGVEEGAHGSGGGDDSKRATKQTIYKIMGYSTHHTSAGGAGARGGAITGDTAYGRGYGHGHGHAHSYRQGHRNNGGGGGGGGVGSGRGGSYEEINYDDYTNTNCDNSLAHGDMIFNHYSRQDEDYPDMEELIEDEDERVRDEWE